MSITTPLNPAEVMEITSQELQSTNMRFIPQADGSWIVWLRSYGTWCRLQWDTERVEREIDSRKAKLKWVLECKVRDFTFTIKKDLS